MNKQIKKILSAMTAAAVCAVNVSSLAANSGIIIDHDMSGVDKGYSFSYENNDKNSTPVMDVMQDGCFECSWNNEENFTAERGLKFASPTEYSKLGKISIRYWDQFELNGYRSPDGYVRFGIQIHNSKGDTFTIMETDDNEDIKDITQKDSRYKKISTLKSKLIFNDTSIFGPVEGTTVDAAYTIYSLEDENTDTVSVLCRKDESMISQTNSDDIRRIELNDKLDAIADAGFDIGEITEINFVVDAAYSKGTGKVYIYETAIENMPEIIQNEWEDEEAPILLKQYNDSGVRTGYYYQLNSSFDCEMEVLAPSLFKSKWYSLKNINPWGPVFQRGKQFKQGQSYKALEQSDAEYSMNIDAEGKYFASLFAAMKGPEKPDNNTNIDMYIVDACQDWLPSQNEQIGTITADGATYDVYLSVTSIVGSFKPVVSRSYYFINRNAEENGKNGKVTAKHELAPFIKFMKENNEFMGTPLMLTVQLDGVASEGSAELVKNEINLPEYIPDNGEYEKQLKKVNLDCFNSPVSIDNKWLEVVGANAEMNGYTDEKLNCVWELSSVSDDLLGPDTAHHRFSVSDLHYSPDSVFFGRDFSTPPATVGIEHQIIDYSIDIGELKDETDNSNYVIGALLNCEDTTSLFDWNNVSNRNYNVVIADKYAKKPGEEVNITNDPSYELTDIGTIETNGAVYNVEKYDYTASSFLSSLIVLTRKEQLEAVTADDVPEGHTRYENTIDVTDIIIKLQELGFKTYRINSGGFSLDTLGNAGSAVINHVDIRYVPDSETVYTEYDIRDFSDYLLGKEVDLSDGRNFDLNGDGVWDTFDLNQMKKRVAAAKTKE